MRFFLNIFILMLCVGCTSQPTSEPISKAKYEFGTLSFLAKDQVRVFADYYDYNGKNAPLILMYHQAGFSRGSLRNIAPRLVDMGFNVLAVDLRAGEIFENIPNLTHQEAKKLNKRTEFTDAIIDLEASLQFAKNNLNSKKIIFWGSSYSASLGFYMVNKYPKDYKALIAFSPGDYFKIDNKRVTDYASNDKIPTFIASARSEEKVWQPIYNAINSYKVSFIPQHSEGRHGTLALSDVYDDSEEYWNGVIPFLKKVK